MGEKAFLDPKKMDGMCVCEMKHSKYMPINNSTCSSIYHDGWFILYAIWHAYLHNGTHIFRGFSLPPFDVAIGYERWKMELWDEKKKGKKEIHFEVKYRLFCARNFQRFDVVNSVYGKSNCWTALGTDEKVANREKKSWR